jgi:hypothetical protein
MGIRGKQEMLIMGGLRLSKRHATWYGAGFVVLLLSFAINIFGVGPFSTWSADFQKDSEDIVTKTVDCKFEHGVAYSGPIQAKNLQYGSGCSPALYQPYASQFGMQSRLISLLAPRSEGVRRYYYAAVKLILAALLATVLMGFVIWAHRRFGPIAASTTLILMALSDWLVGYAPNLYWIAFLMFVPFVYSLLAYPYYREQKRLLVFYGLLAVFFCLKFLDGYEHATTLVISAFIPVVYYEVARYPRLRLVSLWKQAALVLTAGIAGFIVAFAANVVSLDGYYHSWSKSVSAVNSRAEARSSPKATQGLVIYGLQNTLPDIYNRINRVYNLDRLKDGKANPAKYAMLSLLNYILLPAVSLPFILREPFGVIAQSILSLGVIAGVLLRWLRRYVSPDVLRGLSLMYWLGIAGAFSWLVLMPGHAYPHAHLNAIIFYMPYLLVCYLIIGIAISRSPLTRIKIGRA